MKLDNKIFSMLTIFAFAAAFAVGAINLSLLLPRLAEMRFYT
jgi:hypothetical protein